MSYMHSIVRNTFAVLPSDELASTLMTLIEAIREKVLGNGFEFSQHPVDQAMLRRITLQEIREAIGTGK